MATDDKPRARVVLAKKDNYMTPVRDCAANRGHSRRAVEARERAHLEGKEWALGTVAMPGSRFNSKPEWMR